MLWRGLPLRTISCTEFILFYSYLDSYYDADRDLGPVLHTLKFFSALRSRLGSTIIYMKVSHETTFVRFKWSKSNSEKSCIVHFFSIKPFLACKIYLFRIMPTKTYVGIRFFNFCWKDIHWRGLSAGPELRSAYGHCRAFSRW